MKPITDLKEKWKLALFVSILFQAQLPLLRLNDWHDSSREVWDECVDGVLMMSFLFVVIELMWRWWGRRLFKFEARDTIISTCLREISRHPKALGMVVLWWAIVSVMFAALSWIFDLIFQRAAPGFGSYLTLSLAFHGAIVALFFVWHLGVRPRLFPSTRVQEQLR